MEAKLKEFLEVRASSGAGYVYGPGYGSGDGDGYGYGDGYVYGDGDGDGDGSGSGDGYGHGSGSGSGYGYGHGSGAGRGDGYGDGDGDGYGHGSGSGYGHGSGAWSWAGSGSGAGYGYGVPIFNGEPVHEVDGIQTLIRSLKGQVAKGFILQDDLTLKPCFVARVGNYFAHGDTAADAMRDAQEKYDEDRPLEDRIAQFWEAHTPSAKYPASEFYVWHKTLTESCQTGRNQFMAQRGIKMDDTFTPLEFFDMVKTSYGSDAIAQTLAAMPQEKI